MIHGSARNMFSGEPREGDLLVMRVVILVGEAAADADAPPPPPPPPPPPTPPPCLALSF